jgi:hypothetical protein
MKRSLDSLIHQDEMAPLGRFRIAVTNATELTVDLFDDEGRHIYALPPQKVPHLGSISFDLPKGNIAMRDRPAFFTTVGVFLLSAAISCAAIWAAV